MAKTIYKYLLTDEVEQNILIKNRAIIRHVSIQNGGICLWAEVDTTLDDVIRKIFVIGTGWPIPENCNTYIGTVHVDPFVWHVYEE